MEIDKLIEKILATEKCGDIFEQDETKIRKTFRDYIKEVHPDSCPYPKASEAADKLVKLYNSAMEHISKGTWEETGVERLSSKVTLFGVKDISAFELGARYVSDTQVAYVFDSGKGKYRTNYVIRVKSLRYPDKRMQDIYKVRMPNFQSLSTENVQMISGREAVVIQKTSDFYPMDLFLKAYKEQLTGRDIAWMISRMCDLCCFLYSQGLVLNGFTKENLFISPQTHTMSIFGGWWYAKPIGDSMIGTNKTVYSCMSPLTRTAKRSVFQTDIECMRHICTEIIKDKTDIPKPILKWINDGSSDDPISEYESWNEALDKAYGERRFVKFETDSKKIYGR